MCRPRGAKRAAPIIARLSDSVAPDVQTISSADALISPATCARARSIARRRRGHTRASSSADCRSSPRPSGTRASPPRPRHRPASTRRSRDTRALQSASARIAACRIAGGGASARQDAAHDVQLLLVEARAIEQPPQAAHQRTRVVRLQKAGVEQTPFEMLEEYSMPSALAGGDSASRGFLVHALRHANLVGDDLHGHRQVQRAVVRIARDIDQRVAPIELSLVRPARSEPKTIATGAVRAARRPARRIPADRVPATPVAADARWRRRRGRSRQRIAQRRRRSRGEQNIERARRARARDVVDLARRD